MESSKEKIVEKVSDAEPDEEFVEETVFDYLKSDKGHEIVGQIVGIVKEAIQTGLHKSNAERDYVKQRTRDLYIFQAVVFVATVGTASILTYHDKFSPSIAILFGTLVGYVLGRRGAGQQ